MTIGHHFNSALKELTMPILLDEVAKRRRVDHKKELAALIIGWQGPTVVASNVKS